MPDIQPQMECLHSFCHECIVKTVQPGRGTTNACPTCGIKLGNNPFVEKKVVKDQVKVSIVYKLRASGVLVGSGGGGAAAVEVQHRRRQALRRCVRFILALLVV